VDDPSTGLTHLGAREYDSKLGRFISVDSILDVSDPITLNGYRYGNNSPASYSDPEGLRDMLETPDDFGTPPATGEHHTWREKSPEEVEEISHKVILSEVSHHREAKEEAKRVIRKVIKNLVKIVADELGITDALNCFTDGDIGACLSTGVTVLSSFAGGVAGKLLSKYLLHAKKAWKLVGRIKDLIGEAIDGIKGFRKAEEELHKAEEAVGATCSINSFKPGTLVQLADGRKKPIEHLQLGDEVLAADPVTGKVVAESIVRTIIGQGTKDLVELKLTTTEVDGKKSTSVVTATAGHPFYVPAVHRWMDASQLAVGDQLSSLGRPVVVTTTRSYTTLAKVYNLTVNSFHTYYVLAGYTPVLVHNCGVGQAKGSPCTCDADQLFSRFGTSAESTGRLTRKAADAEEHGNGHGLSVTTADDAVEGASVASRADIEAAGFSLRYTPSRNDPMHHTLLLPKPVTSGVKNQFNMAFGRR
jgi:RHS repeat-associated protein